MTNETYTCWTCGTHDFTAGEFEDVTTEPELLQGKPNMFCLACAAKYEEQGVAQFVPIPTIHQLATELAWHMQGIGCN